MNANAATRRRVRPPQAGRPRCGVLAVYAVQKIFFVVIGAFPYLYLFLTVGGSFDLKFKFVKSHPWAAGVLLFGGAAHVSACADVVAARVEMVGPGKGRRPDPRASAPLLRAGVPAREAVSWIAGLGVIAVFLAAYWIPVSFHTLMRIVAGNSIANVTSVTPGGVGVTQAFNVASLKGIANGTTATAYSVAQQLVTTPGTSSRSC